jgi:hypothetical protein
VETYQIRPAYGGPRLLIEFCGDHRAPGFPDVARILAAALGATRAAPSAQSVQAMMASDRYVGAWSYAGGRYEIVDDIWACFILVPDGRDGVVADIERALVRSGRFVRADAPAPG